MRIVVPAVLTDAESTADGSRAALGSPRQLTRIAILSNSWPAMKVMADEMANYFMVHEGVRTVSRGSYPTSQEASIDRLKDMTADVELAVLGVAT